MGEYDEGRDPGRELPEDGGGDAGRAPAKSLAKSSPDVVNIEVGSLEITGTPEDRYALGETIYHLPLRQRGIIMGVLVGIALLSAILFGSIFSNPGTYGEINATLDAKKANVLALTAAATTASTTISLIPDDIGSPIADKLADLSVGFLIILVAIFLEKYLLTVIGFILFVVIIPVCCGLYIVSLALGGYRVTRQAFAHIATKLLLMGIAFFLIVPTSVAIANMIDTTYEESINQTIEQAEQASQQAEESVPAEEPQEAAPEGEGEGSWWDNFINGAQNAIGDATEAVTGAVTGTLTWFQDILNDFIEAMAVMFVTSCIIPILVLILFLFIVKAIFNVDISKPMQMLDPRTYRKAKTTSMTKAS